MTEKDIVNMALSKIGRPTLLKPTCGDCGSDIVITTFADKTHRAVCMGCKRAARVGADMKRIRDWIDNERP
jgi:hypothetical protein